MSRDYNYKQSNRAKRFKMKLILYVALYVILNLILYLSFSFIGLSFNPLDWGLMDMDMGRAMILILFGVAQVVFNEIIKYILKQIFKNKSY